MEKKLRPEVKTSAMTLCLMVFVWAWSVVLAPANDLPPGVPFSFYGKVVDENGAPVSDAKAEVSYYPSDIVIDLYNHENNIRAFQITTNLQGEFLVSGKTAMEMVALVTKEGYYNVPQPQIEHLWQVGRADFPTKQNPVVYKLRKKGVGEPLYEFKSTRFDLQSDGTPATARLETRELSPDGQVTLEVWAKPFTQTPFDWKYRLTVHGGGLVAKEGEFNFLAPDVGYAETISEEFPASKSRMWGVASEYFFRLPDGRYGTLKLTIDLMRPKRTWRIEGYLNPSKSRNLEVDRAKVTAFPEITEPRKSRDPLPTSR